MDYDVIVVGLGPGGEEVATQMALGGRRVLGLDERLLGGECPYFGCIPSKMILRGADMLAEGRRITGFAGTAQIDPDFTPVADRIRDEATDDWDDAVAVERLTKAGATFARLTGVLAGRDAAGRLQVRAGEQTHTGAAVVLNTGTAPAIPPIPGLREIPITGTDGPVWTNREALRARAAPASLIVLGGGAIGCELGQGFARFGSEVTIVEVGAHLLMPEEPEAGAVVGEVFAREGIRVVCGTGVSAVSADADGVTVTLDGGEILHAEKLLVAAGRTPNLANLGLDTVGLDPSARHLDVDEHLNVHSADGNPVEGLFAVGDITGRGAFTHVSVWQAKIVTAHLLGRAEEFGGYHGLAWVTFTDPEVGRVGLTEQQARDQGRTVRVGIQQIASNSRGWIHGPGNDGFIKVVEDVDRGVLVGATAAAPYGGELLGALTLAVHAEVPVTRLRTMHYAYPTLHRAIGEAVAALA